MRLASSGFVLAIALAVTAGSVSTLADQSTPKEGVKASSAMSERPSGTFAALSGVQAAPMTARELREIKGLHIHFTTPSQNAGHPQVEPFTGWHFVNHQENNLGNGQALPISGPGYSGLCGAALKSPTLAIPGQNPVTGVGGGC